MAVTTENSTEYALIVSDPKIAVQVDKWGGRLRFREFNFTQGAAAGDANSLINLVRLPVGARVIADLSHLKRSAFGTGRTLDIGFLAYTKQGGTAVAAVVDKFLDGLDVSAAGKAFMGTGTSASQIFKFDEAIEEGFIDVQAIVLGGTIPAAATLSGWIAYVED